MVTFQCPKHGKFYVSKRVIIKLERYGKIKSWKCTIKNKNKIWVGDSFTIKEIDCNMESPIVSKYHNPKHKPFGTLTKKNKNKLKRNDGKVKRK